MGITLKNPGKISRKEAQQAAEKAIEKLNLPADKDRTELALEAAIKAASRRGFNVEINGKISRKDAAKVAEDAVQKRLKKGVDDPEFSRKEAAKILDTMALFQKNPSQQKANQRPRRNSI